MLLHQAIHLYAVNDIEISMVYAYFSGLLQYICMQLCCVQIEGICASFVQLKGKDHGA